MQHLLAKPHSLTLLMMGVLVLADVVLGVRTPVTFTGWLGPVMATLGLFSVIAVYSLRRSMRAMAELAAYVGTWVIFIAAGCVQTYLAAAHAGPSQDHLLLQIDDVLGFDWVAWVRWIHAKPGLIAVLHPLYMSLLFQVFGSVAIFAATARDRNEELLVSAAVAILLTVFLSATVPAVGPWIYFGYGAGSPDDTLYFAHLSTLHAGDAVSFRMTDLQGIVCFPSYQTVLAVLFVYCHRGIAWTFLPMVVLNGCMLIAIPSEGGHYLADMIGGLAVAIVAVATTRAAMRGRRSLQARAPDSFVPAMPALP